MATIVMANRGIRSMPIKPELAAILTYAAQRAGVDEVRVTSGGQPVKGPNRTGSHRHDLGGSADLQLIVDGKPVSFTDPNGQAIFSRFATAAAAGGATGIGAGLGYMGAKTMHVGFGPEATWGAKGASANAPKWLKEAFAAGRQNPIAYADLPNATAAPFDAVVASDSSGPSRTLSRGTSGTDVVSLQQRLALDGLYKGKIDGTYGRRTMDAVRAYQTRLGLKADGIAGPQTLASLQATAPQPLGATPGAVTEPPPIWPDTFNPPSGLPDMPAVPDAASLYPGLRSTASPGPGGALGSDLAALQMPGERPFRGAPVIPVERGPDLPNAGPVPLPNLRSGMPTLARPAGADQIAPFIPDEMLRPSGADVPLTGTDITPPTLPGGTPLSGYPDMPPLPNLRPGPASTFPARPEFPGALPGAAADQFQSADREWDPIVARQAAMQRELAGMFETADARRGQRMPDLGFATEPSPSPLPTFMPPPFSDRELMLAPRREDITTANSPMAAGIPGYDIAATQAPAPPMTSPGPMPSLGQAPFNWSQPALPPPSAPAPPAIITAAPSATGSMQDVSRAAPAGDAFRNFLKSVLPEQNLISDIWGGATPAPASPSAPIDPFRNTDPNKDQSRLPGMGPQSSLAPMGNITIPPPIQVADASGAWPNLQPYPTDLSTANSPNAAMALPPGVTPTLPPAPAFSDPGSFFGSMPRIGTAPNGASQDQNLPGIGIYTGPPGGIPVPTITPPVVPMPDAEQIDLRPQPPSSLPSPVPTPAPVRNAGLFNGPLGRTILGGMTGGPVGALTGAFSGILGSLLRGGGGAGGFGGAPLGSFPSQFTSGGTYNPWGSSAVTGADPKGFNYAYNNNSGAGYYTDSRGNVHSYSTQHY